MTINTTAPSPKQFVYTGGEQSFTMPAGVGKMIVTLIGAPGGSTNAAQGGRGAAVTAALVPPAGKTTFTAGQTYYVEVGGTNALWEPGFNGGGPGGRSGGGATDIRTLPMSDGANSLSSRLAIAGGGGGAASRGSASGGDAGQSGQSTVGKTGGGAGTQSGGGQGGTPVDADSQPAGRLGDGGSTTSYAGGGGGGLYGGGAGGGTHGDQNPAGGGGGSSFAPNGSVELASAAPQATITLLQTSRLVQPQSGRCATVPAYTTNWSGSGVLLEPCAASTSDPLWSRQQLQVIVNRNGAFTFADGLRGCFDSKDGKSVQGQAIVLASCDDNATQQFGASPSSGGGYLLKQVNSGLFIDTAYGKTDPNTPLVIGRSTGSATQTWSIVATS